LGRKVFRRGAADLILRVEIERADGRWHARIELADEVGPLGARELSTEARHCSALDDSLALVVALLVDTPPERAATSSGVLPAPAAEAAPPGPGARSEPRRATEIRVPADTFAPRQAIRFGLRGHASAAVGLLPGVAPGAGLAVDLWFPRLPRLALLADMYFAQRETLPARDAGASLATERIGIEVCPELVRWGDAGLDGCVGQRVGRLRVDGFGFDRNVSTERLVYALAAGADFRLALASWLDLAASIRAEVPLTRDEFTARATDGSSRVVFVPSVVAASVQFGLGAHF
jgi:hypothetical protein